jgi:hypothetical protein
MIWKKLAMIAVLLPGALAPVARAAQTGHQAAPPYQTAPSAAPSAPVRATPAPASPAASTAAPAPTVNPATETKCEGGACDAALPHITIATPAPAPAPWPLQDRIAWAASLLLTIMAYVGIMLALSALRKIERQTRYGETAAQAAADSAKAALLLAQTQAQAQAQQAESQAQAERPWILITAEPAPGIPNAFIVVATNRGRGPARIVALAEEVTCATDESQLPPVPAFPGEPHAPVVPMILLSGESTDIKSFCRDDVKSVCGTEERLRRVEDWEEKIYLYGVITYRDLRSTDDKHFYETSWCCWYIHGRQKSGMMMAGPPQYNRHS